MAERNWNPHEPYALGLEWAGMRNIAQPLSQDAEYGHTFQSNATETVDKVAFEIIDPLMPPEAGAVVLATVYKRDSGAVTGPHHELSYGTVVSELCPASGGAVSGISSSATLVGGTTVQECLLSPSDNKYVLADTDEDRVTVFFDTAARFTGKRILEVKLHYSMKAIINDIDPDVVRAPADATNLALVLDVAVPGGVYNSLVLPMDVPTTDDEDATASTLRVATLGESVNDFSVAGPYVWPWTVADVQDWVSGRYVEFFFRAFNTGGGQLPGWKLFYCALEVVWCEENREAVAGIGLGTSGEDANAGRHVMFWRQPDGTDNWAKVADQWYAITLCLARSSDQTDDFRTKGPPPYVPMVDGFDVFPQHQGRVSPRLASNVLGAVGVDSRLTPVKFVTTGFAPTIPSDFDPYDRCFGAQLYAAGNNQSQEIEQHSGGGTVDYPWLRFYARIIGDPTVVLAIDITTIDGTTNFYSDDLMALPEIFDGWRQVTLQWPAGQEPSIDNSGSNKIVTFSTTQGDSANRWEILGLDSKFMVGIDAPANGNPTYGGDNTKWIEGANDRNFADLVVTLHTAAPVVSGFGAIGPSPVNVSAPDPDCVPGNFCIPTTIRRLRMGWTATTISTASFAYYEIQRNDAFDSTWQTIAKIVDKTQTTFADYEGRIGVTSTYRMRICRVDGICGDWTADLVGMTATSPTSTPAPGTLVFTSNADPTLMVAYCESFESDRVEGFTFVEAEGVVSQRMFGRFGTQTFHPTERGGVRFERTVLVNALATPVGGTADRAFNPLRDLAWADIPYVCVKDDQGNRWFATLVVPDGSMRRSKSLYLANIRVIESTLTPFPASA